MTIIMISSGLIALSAFSASLFARNDSDLENCKGYFTFATKAMVIVGFSVITTFGLSFSGNTVENNTPYFSETLVEKIVDSETLLVTDIETTVARYFIDKGLDPLQVAAVMGNIYAESGFDAGAIEVSNGLACPDDS